jgi:hypothetical protein
MGMPSIFPDVIPKEKDPLEYPEGMGEDYEEEYEEYASVARPFLFFSF